MGFNASNVGVVDSISSNNGIGVSGGQGVTYYASSGFIKNSQVNGNSQGLLIRHGSNNIAVHNDQFAYNAEAGVNIETMYGMRYPVFDINLLNDTFINDATHGFSDLYMFGGYTANVDGVNMVVTSTGSINKNGQQKKLRDNVINILIQDCSFANTIPNIYGGMPGRIAADPLVSFKIMP
jgi:hypothetical protein